MYCNALREREKERGREREEEEVKKEEENGTRETFDTFSVLCTVMH